MKYTPANTVEIGIRADVWVNGEPVDQVLEADTTEGYVIRAKIKDGKVCHDGENILQERIEGVVTVKTRYGR